TPTETSPAVTIFISPGGSSSTGHTSSSGTLVSCPVMVTRSWRVTGPGRRQGCPDYRRTGHLAELELVQFGQALGERCAPPLVQCDLERGQSEDCALQAHRSEGDPDLLEQILLRHRRHLARLPPLDHLGEHRGRSLRDRAAAPGELDVVDRVPVVAESNEDRDLVAAEGVLAFRLG